MSRFGDGDEEGMPLELWETVISNALGGPKGQTALAAMEEALLALPEPKLISGHLACDGQVCAVGAFVAHKKATEENADIQTVIDAMGAGVKCWCNHSRESHTDGACSGTLWQGKPCGCSAYDQDGGETDYETAAAGADAGLPRTIAWHLAYLNDEQFASGTPEARYEQMLTFVRRAQGKPVLA